MEQCVNPVTDENLPGALLRYTIVDELSGTLSEFIDVLHLKKHVTCK